jgi:hypothetical protein
MAQVIVSPETQSNRLKIVAGEVALDGSNPTNVDLSAIFQSTVVAVAVGVKNASAPGVGTSVVTYNISGRTVSLYGWKVTAVDDATLVASTGTDTITYLAVGY